MPSKRSGAQRRKAAKLRRMRDAVGVSKVQASQLKRIRGSSNARLNVSAARRPNPPAASHDRLKSRAPPRVPPNSNRVVKRNLGARPALQNGRGSRHPTARRSHSPDRAVHPQRSYTDTTGDLERRRRSQDDELTHGRELGGPLPAQSAGLPDRRDDIDDPGLNIRGWATADLSKPPPFDGIKDRFSDARHEELRRSSVADSERRISADFDRSERNHRSFYYRADERLRHRGRYRSSSPISERRDWYSDRDAAGRRHLDRARSRDELADDRRNLQRDVEPPLASQDQYQSNKQYRNGAVSKSDGAGQVRALQGDDAATWASNDLGIVLMAETAQTREPSVSMEGLQEMDAQTLASKAPIEPITSTAFNGYGNTSTSALDATAGQSLPPTGEKHQAELAVIKMGGMGNSLERRATPKLQTNISTSTSASKTPTATTNGQLPTPLTATTKPPTPEALDAPPPAAAAATAAAISKLPPPKQPARYDGSSRGGLARYFRACEEYRARLDVHTLTADRRFVRWAGCFLVGRAAREWVWIREMEGGNGGGGGGGGSGGGSGNGDGENAGEREPPSPLSSWPLFKRRLATALEPSWASGVECVAVFFAARMEEREPARRWLERLECAWEDLPERYVGSRGGGDDGTAVEGGLPDFVFKDKFLSGAAERCKPVLQKLGPEALQRMSAADVARLMDTFAPVPEEESIDEEPAEKPVEEPAVEKDCVSEVQQVASVEESDHKNSEKSSPNEELPQAPTAEPEPEQPMLQPQPASNQPDSFSKTSKSTPMSFSTEASAIPGLVHSMIIDSVAQKNTEPESPESTASEYEPQLQPHEEELDPISQQAFKQQQMQLNAQRQAQSLSLNLPAIRYLKSGTVIPAMPVVQANSIPRAPVSLLLGQKRNEGSPKLGFVSAGVSEMNTGSERNGSWRNSSGSKGKGKRSRRR